MSSLSVKHLFGLQNIPENDIENILDTALSSEKYLIALSKSSFFER